MKFLFTVILLYFAVCFHVSSQSVISFTSGNVRDFHMESTGKAFTQINFNNETDEVLLLDWETTVRLAPDSWSYQTCDNGFCHEMVPPLNQINRMNPIQPKSQAGMGFMNMEMLSRDCSGKETATFEFRIFMRESKEEVGTVRFNFRCYPTSRMDTEQNLTIRIVPNPVQDFFSVANADQSALEYAVITDLTGKTVATHNLNEAINASLDVSNLNAGVYFVNVFDINGNSHIQRLIKQ